MTGFAHCQSDNFCEATSPITGHRLRVNLSFNRVFVPADMPIDRARALGAQLPAYWKTQGRNRQQLELGTANACRVPCLRRCRDHA